MGGTYLDLDALEGAERSGQRYDPGSFMRRTEGGESFLDLDAAEEAEEKPPTGYQRFSSTLDKILSATRAPLDALSEKVSGGYAKDDPRRNQWGVVPSSEIGLDAIIPPNVGNDTPLVSGLGHLSALSLPTVPLTHGNMLLGKAEKAALALGIPEKVVGIPRALERKGAGLLLGLGTDPASAIGAAAGVNGVLGKGVSVGERALAGLGAVAGGKGAIEAGGRVVEDLKKGELIDAGLDAVDVVTGAGMGYLGAKGARAKRVEGAPGRVERAAQHVERNLEQIQPELAAKVKAFDNDAAVLTGQWSARLTKAMDSLGVNKRRAATIFSEKIQPVIEGKAGLDTLSPQEAAVASEVRGLLDEVGSQAKEAGVLAEVEANYFPRLPKDMSATDFYSKAREQARREGRPLEDVVAEARGNSTVIASRAGRKVGALEKERGAGKVALQEGDYRTDPGALFDYVQQAGRRISEARHLGPNGELAQGLINRIDVEGNSGARDYAQTAIDRMRGVEPRSKVATEASALARQGQSFASLGLAPITQLTSLAQTAAYSGIGPTLRAMGRVARGWKQAKLDAMEAGALAGSTGRELADVWGTGAAEGAPYGFWDQVRHPIEAVKSTIADVGKAKTAAGKVGAVTARAPHLQLTGVMDEAQRVVAAKTAEFLVPKLLKQAEGTGMQARARQRQLADLGIKPGEVLSPELIQRAAKRIADKTQFRTGMSQLPLWATSPLGRAAFQFQSFGYQHTRFLGWMAGEATKGNVAPLAKWAAVGAAVGGLSNELKDLIKGHGYDKFTEDDWARNLKDAVGKGRHADVTKNPLLVAARGLAAAGGMGAIGSLIERAQDAGSHPLAAVAGPSGSDAEQLLRTGADVATAGVNAGSSVLSTLGGDEEGARASAREAGKNLTAAGKAVGRTALQQVPVFGGQLSQELLSDEKPARAGTVGKAIDALEDKGVLTRKDQTESGTAGRERAAEMQQIKDDRSDTTKRTEAMLTATEKAPLAVRLEKARKSGQRADFENLIVEAMSAGDTERAFDIAREARKVRVKFSRQDLAKLQGRVIPRRRQAQEDTEEEE